MTLKSKVFHHLSSQFMNPRGAGGHLTGWIMGHRSSNVERSRWVVALLDLASDARVLEVGCGPGVAVEAAAARMTRGYVCGVDPSAVMVKQATRRNTDAIQAGRVDIVHAAAESLPDFDDPFDDIVTINSLWFWPDPPARLQELRKLLRPGGTIAVGAQPRTPGADESTAITLGGEISSLLEGAGFGQPRVERLDLTPPALCIMADA